MDRLITDFSVQVVEPGCAPGSGSWGLLITLPNDISPVFPYLNAVLDNVQYDHENRILIWGDRDHKYACRSHDIRVARIENNLEAGRFAEKIIGQINDIWQKKDTITPRYTEKKKPSVLDIFKLLPRTNCKQCGYQTCMAFAAELSKGAVQPKRCIPLAKPEYLPNRQKLLTLILID